MNTYYIVFVSNSNTIFSEIVVCFITHYMFNIGIILSFHDLYHDCKKKTLNCANYFMKIFFFKIMKKESNELEEIFLTLKDIYDEKLVLYEKNARISAFSKKHLCHNTFMILLNQVVSVFKEITIDNLIFLNIYENPSFCSTLLVFKNGFLTPWLKLKFSSIENSGLGVFSSRNFKKNEFITCYLVKLIRTLQMMSILSRRLTANQ